MTSHDNVGCDVVIVVVPLETVCGEEPLTDTGPESYSLFALAAPGSQVELLKSWNRTLPARSPVPVAEIVAESFTVKVCTVEIVVWVMRLASPASLQLPLTANVFGKSPEYEAIQR
jgi:hypothetical protein